MKRLWIALGFLCFALGAVGAFFPVLPTVPFLLLASFCFTRGSAKYDTWFKSTKLYQKHLKDYTESRAMTLRSKLCILLPVSALLLLLMVLIDNAVMRVALGVVLVLKYYYFSQHIKTLSKAEEKARKSIKEFPHIPDHH